LKSEVKPLSANGSNTVEVALRNPEFQTECGQLVGDQKIDRRSYKINRLTGVWVLTLNCKQLL